MSSDFWSYLNHVLENDPGRCARCFEDGEWVCENDHTGCLYNDSCNGCSHEGDSLHPLEEES